MNITLFGATAAVHDHVAGSGDFDAVCAQLEAASTLEVTTGVTRSNARSLAALAQFLTEPRRRAKIQRWTLSWPGPQSPGLALPRLGMVTPRVLHAAALARREGLVVFTEGLPSCVLGPHANHAARVDPRAHASVCKTCSRRTACPGVPEAYITAFDRDLELRTM